MARGRGYGGPIIITSTGAGDSLLGTGSTRASRLSSYTLSDQDDLRRHSRRQDRALLDGITNKLLKLDFDRVKPETEVALKTGFRRIMYSKKHAPLEKETRERLRMDRLRYPWDYTNNSMYRPKPDSQRKKSLKQKVKEQAEQDHYPTYDPLGLYKPREKRNRAPYPDAKDWETPNVQDILTDLRVKAFSKRVTRDPSDDTDTILRDLSRPLPKSEVAAYVPYTGNLSEFKPAYDADFEIDPKVHKKIAESKVDLNEFDRVLNERFSKKGAPGLSRSVAQRQTEDEIRREENKLLLRRAREFDLPARYDYTLTGRVPNGRFSEKVIPGLSRADAVLAFGPERTADEIRREENKLLLRRAREFNLAVGNDDTLNDRILNGRLTKKVTPGLSRADAVLAVGPEKTADEIRREENKLLMRRAREFELDVGNDDTLNDRILNERFSKKVTPGLSRADAVLVVGPEKTADEIRREENKMLLRRAREFNMAEGND